MTKIITIQLFAKRLGAVFRTPDDNDSYILYQEPKKKVVRYLFAVRTTQDGWTVRPYFITDNEAVRIYSKTDIVDFKRLDYTATEFEE